jgi:hypothetical protein
MRVFIRHHLAAGRPFENALRAAGHEIVPAGADAVLLDLDLPYMHDFIDSQIAAGAKVFTYPHGVGVFHYWDGIEPPYERVSGSFVVSEGYAEVYRRIGLTRPFYVVGWPYCEIRPFRSNPEPRKVLFAPEHPLENGDLVDWIKDLNRTAYEELLAVPGIELTVRHLQTLERNGLWHVPGVNYVEGQPDNSFDDIDRADVVVAGGTYAHIAVARGAPTVMFSQRNVHPSNGEHRGNERRYAQNWDKWRDYVRFPFHIGEGATADVLQAAAATEDGIREWKRLFIGDSMTPERFSAALEQAMKDTVELPETRSFVVLADAGEVVTRPALLAAYADAFGPGDDATLVLLAPPGDQSALVERLGNVFADLDLPDDVLPDMVLSADPVGLTGRVAFVDVAHARLSEHDVTGAWELLPRFDATTARELRTLATTGAAEPIS